MRKHRNKALLLILTIALAAALASCGIFMGADGDTYLGIEWEEDWDCYYTPGYMPFPFDGWDWHRRTYYEVEPGSYYGYYYLDGNGDEYADTPTYRFDITIDEADSGALFSDGSDTYWELYLLTDGAYFGGPYYNSEPVERTLAPDGSLTSTISAGGRKITLKSRVVTDVDVDPSLKFQMIKSK